MKPVLHALHPRSTAREFLGLVFEPAADAGRIGLITLPNPAPRWYDAEASDALAQEAITLSDRGAEVYITCGIFPPSYDGPRAAGAVSALPGVWADIDHVKPGAARRYFRDVGAIHGFLDTLVIRPTLRVETGGGVHAWWLFREPLYLAGPRLQPADAHVVWRFQRYLQGRMQPQGVDLDATHDHARILRIPGTVNHKHGAPVRLTEHRGPRLDVADLRDLLDAGGIPAAPQSTPDALRRAVWVDPAAAPPADKFARLCQQSPRFAATWRRDRPDLQDQSPSAYDLALAHRAAVDGWTDLEIVALLVAHRRLHADAPKLRADYYARTLARAREARTAAQAFSTRTTAVAPRLRVAATAATLRVAEMWS